MRCHITLLDQSDIDRRRPPLPIPPIAPVRNGSVQSTTRGRHPMTSRAPWAGAVLFAAVVLLGTHGCARCTATVFNPNDAGEPGTDAGPTPDSGTTPDAGPGADAGPGTDSGTPDAGPRPDGGGMDGGTPDSGVTVDSGTPDAGSSDA